jgi:hypothetical protein
VLKTIKECIIRLREWCSKLIHVFIDVNTGMLLFISQMKFAVEWRCPIESPTLLYCSNLIYG